MLIIGGLAYLLSDVNSNNGFTNTLLPFLAMLTFVYGVIVTINMLFNMRKKVEADKSSELLFESMKEAQEKNQEKKSNKENHNQKNKSDGKINP